MQCLKQSPSHWETSRNLPLISMLSRFLLYHLYFEEVARGRSSVPPLTSMIEDNELPLRTPGFCAGLLVQSRGTVGVHTDPFRMTGGRRSGCSPVSWALAAALIKAMAETHAGAGWWFATSPPSSLFQKIPQGSERCLDSWKNDQQSNQVKQNGKPVSSLRLTILGLFKS